MSNKEKSVREKIKELLKREFTGHMCEECRHEDNDQVCQDCTEVVCKWEISEEFNDRLTSKILDIVVNFQNEF